MMPTTMPSQVKPSHRRDPFLNCNATARCRALRRSETLPTSFLVLGEPPEMEVRAQTDLHVEVHEFHVGVVTGVVILALVLEAFLPIHFPRASVIELPLLVTIYFALSRRNPSAGMLLGMIIGLAQDSLKPHADWIIWNRENRGGIRGRVYRFAHRRRTSLEPLPADPSVFPPPQFRFCADQARPAGATPALYVDSFVDCFPAELGPCRPLVFPLRSLPERPPSSPFHAIWLTEKSLREDALRKAKNRSHARRKVLAIASESYRGRLPSPSLPPPPYPMRHTQSVNGLHSTNASDTVA